MNPLVVKLDPSDFEVAASVGIRRQADALRRGLSDTAGVVGRSQNGLSRLDIHILGACGEAAYARVFNCYWGGSNLTFRTRPDVNGVEVRTRSRHDYELIVRDKDDDKKVFVLVTCEDDQFLEFRVCGWILGGDAKRPEWRKGHGGRDGAYFVPHSALNRFDRPGRAA